MADTNRAVQALTSGMTDTPKATPGVCANRMYASIGGRCCAHCGQQIHHDGNGWRHIATKQAACATVPA